MWPRRRSTACPMTATPSPAPSAPAATRCTTKTRSTWWAPCRSGAKQANRCLLCLRNIEPRKGKWTLPAGFMELAETTAEGALRETIEEAGAQIEMGELFTAHERAPRRPGAPVLPRPPAQRRSLTPGSKPWRPGCSPKTRSPGTKSPFAPCAKRWSTTSKTGARASLAFTRSTSPERGAARRAPHQAPGPADQACCSEAARR